MRDVKQLGEYGIVVSAPAVDYSRLLVRVRAVVEDVQAHSYRRKDFESLGITVQENVGVVRFTGSQQGPNPERCSSSGRQDHPLHWWCESPAARSGI